jgi:hypothetical protein
MDITKKTWPLRLDPRLKPVVERIATKELRRSTDMVGLLIVEALERRGVLQRSDLAVDRTEAAA